MENIFIREAHPDDIDGIREVHKRTWIAAYPNEAYGITKEDIEARFLTSPEKIKESRERQRRYICSPSFHSWVTLADSDLIGFCTIQQDEHLIQSLYVLPDYQHKGIGKRLLQAALNWFGPGTEVILDVASYNENAIAFYRAFGFVPDGPLPPEDLIKLPSGILLPAIKMVRRGL